VQAEAGFDIGGEMEAEHPSETEVGFSEVL
jgi:hypothetical protein